MQAEMGFSLQENDLYLFNLLTVIMVSLVLFSHTPCFHFKLEIHMCVVVESVAIVNSSQVSVLLVRTGQQEM